jgi:tether containing UBX domain for GLUT4
MKEISDFFSSIDTVPAGIGSSASQGREGAHGNGAMDSVPDAEAENAAMPLEDEAKPEPSEDIPATDGPTAQPVENDVVASSSHTEPQSQPTASESTQPPTTINGISVYRPPSSSTPAAALLADDPSVFEPSIDHARSHQTNLQQAGKNKRLLSDKELAEIEETRQANLATIQSVVVRVRYPDQSQIETTIYASETAADLYAKVMDTLAAAPEPFELRYTATKGHETIPNSSSKRLVRHLGFKGRVLVTLVWSPDASAQAQRGPSLKEEYRKHATELKVELASQQTQGESAHRTAMQKPEAKTSGGKGSGPDLETKMKRFLGFAKKG